MGCSGYLVESAGTRIVLDFGPGILPELRRHADFRRLDGIVISHMHIDHALDLLALRHALAYNPERAPGPVLVWLPPGGRALLAEATAPFDRCDDPGVFERTVLVRDYDPTATLAIDTMRITFAPTVHYVPGYAMRVTDQVQRAIGYTGDTGPTADLAGIFSDVGILIAEATLLEPGNRLLSTRGSLTAAEAGDLARRADARTLLLTHLWQELGFENARMQAASTFSGRIELARPGLTMDL
jgi:ribonuclease BN (tRNA processing enzyme)